MDQSNPQAKEPSDAVMQRYIKSGEARDQRRIARQRYDKFIRTLIEQFRRESLICDFHIGITSGHQGDDLDDEDLYSLIGKGGIMDVLIDTIYRKKIPCTNLMNDLHDIEDLDEFYCRSIAGGPTCETLDLVKKTIGDFHRALDAYVKWELQQGHRTDDDPENGIDNRIENPTLLRYYLMAQSGDYDSSHCEYPHGR